MVPNVLECTDSSPSSILFAFVYVSFEQGRQWMSNWMSFPPPLQEPSLHFGSAHLYHLRNLCSHSLRGAANHSLPSYSTFLHRILPSVVVVGEGIAAAGAEIDSRLRECSSQVEPEVVSNSRNKIHQTWFTDVRRSLYMLERAKHGLK